MRARRAWSTSAGGLGASGGAVCAKHAAASSAAIAIRNFIPSLYGRVSCTVLEPRHLTIGCSRSVGRPILAAAAFRRLSPLLRLSAYVSDAPTVTRSEERRVGKEC